jgi:hypothetical protein
MAKTYNTIPTVSTGDVYTATSHNNIVENVNGYRVPPMVRATRAAAQSIANNANGAVRFDTQTFDTDDMFAATSNVITFPTAGIYLLTANMTWDANATGLRVVGIYHNPTLSANTDAATVTAGTRIAHATNAAINGAATNLFTATTYEFAANDTACMSCFQTSGGSLNTRTDDLPTFTATWLGQVS